MVDHARALRAPGDRVWRWWLLWVLGTNAGFFPGMFLAGLPLSRALAPSVEASASPVVAGVILAVLTALPVGLLTGIGQWLALRMVVPHSRGWVWRTLVGWTLGTAVAAAVLFGLDPDTDTLAIGPILLTSALGGAMTGVFQQPVLRALPGARAWVLASTLGWASQFPGALAGLWIVRGLKPRSRG